jgi:hypothetical protein
MPASPRGCMGPELSATSRDSYSTLTQHSDATLDGRSTLPLYHVFPVTTEDLTGLELLQERGPVLILSMW